MMHLQLPKALAGQFIPSINILNDEALKRAVRSFGRNIDADGSPRPRFSSVAECLDTIVLPRASEVNEVFNGNGSKIPLLLRRKRTLSSPVVGDGTSSTSDNINEVPTNNINMSPSKERLKQEKWPGNSILGGCTTMSQRQAACLLAHAMLSTMPPHPEGFDGNDVDGSVNLSIWRGYQDEKCMCILQYFSEIHRRIEANSEWQGTELVFARVRAREGSRQDWEGTDAPLLPFEACPEGTIEKDGAGCLQADFANEYIGGGVLAGGSVQEEIRFTISPECLVSLMLCEVMLSDEAVLIGGTEIFSKYSGYGGSFAYAGPETDGTPMNKEDTRRNSAIVAYDATPFYDEDTNQYEESAITRELNKCLAAVLPSEAIDDVGDQRQPSQPISGTQLSRFATGNWGSGVFGGDPQLKSLLQWAAASLAGRGVVYYYFGDERVMMLDEIVAAVEAKKLNVGALCKLLFEYDAVRNDSDDDLFSYMLGRLKQ